MSLKSCTTVHSDLMEPILVWSHMLGSWVMLPAERLKVCSACSGERETPCSPRPPGTCAECKGTGLVPLNLSAMELAHA